MYEMKITYGDNCQYYKLLFLSDKYFNHPEERDNR